MSTPPMLRVHRPFVAALAACALAATAAAQGSDTELNARQAKAMNNFAKKALKEGFPRVAKQVWMQLIKLYEPDNAEAWTALGYV
ncbi:MAG: hypothetical protein ACK6D2_15335, partial [Planctomycetota bacterium]